MGNEIIGIKGREIIDSRGNPTVEVEMWTDGNWVRASAPSGASTGVHEVLELRDKEKRYNGKGVRKAVANVNGPIAEKLKGVDATKQGEIDKMLIELDGTPNKGKLGGNATVAVSMAAVRLGAHVRGIPLSDWIGKITDRDPTTLPVPFMNILNGGKHAGTGLSIQEFMIVPAGAPSFSEALQVGAEIYHALAKIIVKKYGVGARNVGDEGGYAPPIKDARSVLDAISEAISETGYDGKVFMGMDAAASSFYNTEKDTYSLDGEEVKTDKLLSFYEDILKTYPIVSLEDPFQEEDFDSYAALNKSSGEKTQIVGDDLTVTNVNRVKKALETGSMSCLLLKLNQIGTVSEALAAAKMMFDQGKHVMVSHRSGETSDYTISDLATGISCGQIKAGAPGRGERTAKYNELLRIEERLGNSAKYAGMNFRK